MSRIRTSAENLNRFARSLWVVISLAGALSLIAACGGGGGGGGSVAGGGIGGTGISQGTITGFGSLIVNEVTYNDDTAAIIIDDLTGNNSQLHIGQVVRIEFSASGGVNTATKITYDSDLKGPVDAGSVSVADDSLEVLGQSVKIDDSTVFANGFVFGATAEGKVIEVSGFRDTANVVHATRIELKPGFVPSGGNPIKVEGEITSADNPSRTFTLDGGLTVNWFSAVLKDTSGNFGSGDFVEVRAASAPVGNVLTATRVELEKPGLGAASGTKAEVEGLVTDLSGSTFKVNGQLIDASSATFEPSGSTLALGIRVEVEGTIQSSGILVATKVEVKQETSVRIEAHVTELNGPPAKTLKVLGKTISLRGSTQFEDKVNNTRPFNLGNFDSVISVGDHLEVRAVKNKAGDLIATRVERNSDTEISLQGPLESESPLTIVGLPILTDGGTEFRDVDDSTIGSLAAFLNKVKVTPTPSIVKARGADAGADFNATGAVNGELEIEEP